MSDEQLIKESLAAITILQNKIAELEKTTKEPIAVIGMSCRFPGGAESPEEFWSLLQAGFDSSIEVPKDRWNIDEYYDPDPTIPGKIISRKSSFITSSIADFDADFFGISPREAEYMDPQQRLLLEVTWESLEDAGINPRSLLESLTGVFIGISSHDYEDLLTQALSTEAIGAYFGTGNAASTATGRISYTLGLQGPSLAVDTACSSSLVAIHQACLSLHSGDSDLAIAGGVNVLLSPLLSVDFSQAHMLAPDGHCKTFDKEADGYVRGEGCGIIILKRLSDALHDNDKILGVIKGSAVNQDGASSGLTVPNGPAQETVIKRALAQAKLTAADIDYIEVHGTGTALGDPIEFNALAKVFKGRDKALTIGTVKTNIGHLEAAAGIAGIIKTLLALQHEKIPRHLHFKELNPSIDLAIIPAQIPLQAIDWKKRDGKIRRAGVSSFGFSGTNAHIILQEAPTQDLTQIHQPLPKTIFNRQRYWVKALDDQREKQLIFNKDWYVEEIWIAQPLLGTVENKVFKHYVWVKGDTLLDSFAAALGAQVISANDLVVTLEDLENVCVIDAHSYLDFKDENDVVAKTEALMLRYQGWLKLRDKVSRWVLLNQFHDYPSSDVLLNLAKVLNWEQASEVQYIGLARDDVDIVTEIARGDETYVVYREEGRYVPRLAHADMVKLLSVAPTLTIEPDVSGVYLITGGLGGLGFALLKMLLATGFKRFILVSRHKPDATQEKEIQELQTEFNAEIMHAALDISDRVALETLIKSVTSLSGVFHLAGVEVGENFEDYTSLQIQSILKPKMAGAWNLHELTKDLSLQYFVFFSSISSLLGSNRQAPYVLANGYLDSLARYRVAQGLPITSIQWGPWAGVGMTTQDERFSRSNRDYISVDKGLETLKKLLSLPPVVGLSISPQEALRFRLHFHQHLPQWLNTFFTPGESKTAGESGAFIKMYYLTPEKDRHAFASSYIEENLRAVMHFAPERLLDKKQGFFEMGMDSLMAVELFEKIKRDMGDALTLRAMTVFDYPSVEKLTDYLIQTLTGLSQAIYITGGSYTREPIAVIGLDCRFPAGGEDAETFWASLIEGTDAIRYPDRLRWDKDVYPYKAGLLNDIDLFDADFFGISPREAEMIDPQQRLVLEIAWHALEASGIDPKSLKGSSTGVFIGISQSDYGQLLVEQSGADDFYAATGMALSVAAGRLSYTLGLQGPTMVIDTACSSSLVALHEACRSLQEQDCNLAIAGGVNVLLSPTVFALLTQGNMLSPEGYCKTFDKDADGYVRGEGCGIVILKRLSDAARDNDNILAVIKGSAVNQDGASSGLTVPNGLAQEQVLATALANADVEPNTVDYIETHGTGTSLGDPIEVGAIQTIYGQQREHPLTLGAVKTNIGHLESAGGIAGVIKTILALQHELIPKNLHFKEINPAIHLDAIPAQIPIEAIPWKKQVGKIRRAGVSSFGFSGTNAHMIIEEAPERDLSQIKLALPKTIFNRKSYWALSNVKDLWKNVGFNVDETAHPFLQHRVELPSADEIYFESIIDVNYPDFIADHSIYDFTVIAGADYLSMALSLARDVLGGKICRLQKIEFIEALVINKPTRLWVKAKKAESNIWKLEVYSQVLGQSETQLRVTMEMALLEQWEDVGSLEEMKLHFPIQTTYTRAQHLLTTQKLALTLGPHFQWLEEVYTHASELLAKLRAPDEPLETSRYVYYPGLIDSVFQSGLALAQNMDTLEIPFYIESFTVNLEQGIPGWAYSSYQQTKENQNRHTDYVLYNSLGKPVGYIHDFVTQAAPKSALMHAMKRQVEQPSVFYETVWQTTEMNSDSAEDISTIKIYDARMPTEDIITPFAATRLLTWLQEAIKNNSGGRHVVFTGQAFSLHDERIDLNQALLNGLLKTAILEYPGLHLQQVDVLQDIVIDTALLEKIATKESIVALRAQKFYTERLLPYAQAERQQSHLVLPLESPWELVQENPGDLERLRLVNYEQRKLLSQQVEIEISAVGLNFRDVLVALDLYPGESGVMGGDCAGIITRVGTEVNEFKAGDKVFGIALGAFRSHAITDQRLIALLPEVYSFADCAALPTIMFTAHYALNVLAEMKPNDKVLIHTGAGGVGLLAIQMAQQKGAVIYTTASSSKQAYLRSLGIEHVYDSRNTDFAQQILKDTQGQGVDIILNTLTSEGFKEASLSCLKQGGIFLEISKRNIYTQEMLASLRPDVHYHIIAFDQLCRDEPALIQQFFQTLLPLLQDKTLHPPVITRYPLVELPTAMRYLQQGKNTGKVVIEFPPLEIEFKANASYLITGGLGGVGLEVAHYLAEHGAKRIILTGRHTPAESATSRLEEIRTLGVDVVIAVCDVSIASEINALIKDNAKKDYPLKGIFHLAGVIEDAPLDKQTQTSFTAVFAPKALGAWNLHEATKEIPLDYFILFSSMASMYGSPGQSNYAAANGFLDALAIYRRQQGLAATSINWGPWRDVGMAKDLVARHERQGMKPLATPEALAALNYALKQSSPQLGIIQADWKKMSEGSVEITSWLESLLERKSGPDFIKTLQATPLEQRETLLTQAVTQEIKKVLGQTVSIDESKGFFEMGMDSLMALELKNRLQVLLGISLSNTVAFDYPTLNTLLPYLLSVLKIKEMPTLKPQIQYLGQSEPIAIIGMSCRFPGGANSVEEFWQLLEAGFDSSIEVPKSRWDIDAYYDPDPDAKGKMVSRKSSFMTIPIDEFDADFFGISPREAEYLDPQQRLLLEVTWEALEDARIEPKSLNRSLTGVFIGISSHDYEDLLTQSLPTDEIDAYLGTGNAASTATGRISYTLGLQGPSVAMDTACSSSLVALHEACLSLRNGDSDLTIAGGVNVILSPTLSIDFSQAHMLAPDGYCKTFDKDADGYVRGEGCGIIILKRFNDAVRDNDKILGVIKGSAVNQDGASSGLTVPNGPAQEAVIQRALAQAKLTAADIDYIEAHGTGTALGDPIEFNALAQVFKGRENALTIGTVKTNIGHLEAAAGIAGVIKTILALQHEKIPKHLHFKEINPSIDLTVIPAQIPLQAIEWNKQVGKIRRAGVSSFGFSGTNAHIIIEEAPEQNDIQFRQSLPKTLFNRQRYWAEALNHKTKFGAEKEIHPLLGARLPVMADHKIITFQEKLSLYDIPYLNDHKILGQVIFPGTAYVEMLIAAIGVMDNTNKIITLIDLAIERPLQIPSEHTLILQTVLNAEESEGTGEWSIALYSQQESEDIFANWILHVQAKNLENNVNEMLTVNVATLQEQCPEKVDVDLFYQQLAKKGLEYGHEFQLISQLSKGTNVALGKLVVNANVDSRYFVYPPLLDACLQMLDVFSNDNESTNSDIYLPIGIEKLTFYKPLCAVVYAYVYDISSAKETLKANVKLANEFGEVLLELIGFKAKKTTRQNFFHLLQKTELTDQWAYMPNWQVIDTKTNSDEVTHNNHWFLVNIKETIVSSFKKEAKLRDEKVILLATLPFNEIQKDDIVVYQAPHLEISSPDSANVETLLVILQNIIRQSLSLNIWIITTQAYFVTELDEINLGHVALNGFLKTVIQEHPELKIRQIDLPVSITEKEQVEILINEAKINDDESVVAYRAGQRYVERLETAKAVRKEHEGLLIPAGEFRLEKSNTGVIAQLQLIAEEPLLPKDDEVLVAIKTVGLNFRDVLNAMNLYPGDPGPLGGDAAGIILAVGPQVTEFKVGDEVLGLFQGSLASQALTKPELLVHKPPSLDFANAASIPTIFLTAYYALIELAQIKPGDTVLIHAATGGVGIAALQVARAVGARIIASAGSDRKRNFLEQWGVKDIVDSRSLEFGAAIKKFTEGRGVDVVLNSLSGAGFIETTLAACATNARFVEIGKRDIWTPEQMLETRPDVTYSILAIDVMAKETPEQIQVLLEKIISWFKNGKFQAIPLTIFSLTDSIKAFKYLQQAQQIGKVIIEIPASSLHFNPNASYLITGGLGGIGLELMQWLGEHYARHIILAARRVADEKTQNAIKELQQKDIFVEVKQVDVANKQAVDILISELKNSVYPLKGIFHTAGSIQDLPITEQTAESLQHVFNAKALGAWYLHEAVQRYEIELDYFELFSSIASINGSPGQSNYAAANSVLDGIAHYRHEKGLKAQSINWGPWAEVGMAKNLVSVHRQQGVTPFKTKEALAALEYALKQRGTQELIAHINWSYLKKKTLKVPSWLRELIGSKVPSDSLLETINLLSAEQQIEKLKEVLRNEVRKILRLPIQSEIVEDKNFFELGMDSLMALELKNQLQIIFDKALPNTFIFDYSSLEKLNDYFIGYVKQNKSVIKSENPYSGAPEIKLPPLEKQKHEGKMPLSLNERAIWVAQKESSGNVYLNMKMLFFIDGKIDKDLFETAINHVVLSNEILRTTYHQDDKSQLYRQIHDDLSVKVALYDLESLDVNSRQQTLREVAQETEHKIFELESLPLFETVLVKLTELEYALILSMHHMVGDGNSIGLVFNQIFLVYKALKSKQPITLPLEPITYTDYAIWQQKVYKEGLLEPLVKYWDRKIVAVESLNLPYDNIKRAFSSATADVFSFQLNNEQVTNILTFVNKNKTTPYILFMGAFQLLLKQITGQSNLLIETILSNRLSSNKNNLLGALATDGVALYEVNENLNVKDFLSNLLEETLEINNLQQDCGPLIYNTIAQKFPGMPTVGINYHSQNFSQLTDLKFKFDTSFFSRNTLPGNLDLFLEIWPLQNGIQFDFIYRIDVFEKQTLERICEQFLNIIDFFIINDSAKLNDYKELK